MESQRVKLALRPILASAADLLGIELSDETDPQTRRLVLCGNAVAQEIAERVPIVVTETVRADGDGRVPYAALSLRARSVRGVTENGVRRAYRATADGIEVSPGALVDATYVGMPSRVGLGGALQLDDRVGPDTVCFGVCAAFCRAEGLVSDAEKWHARFEDALGRIPPRSGRSLPKRGLR